VQQSGKIDWEESSDGDSRHQQGRADPCALASRWWFGYGRWDAPYWYVGKEPGGTGEGDAESWLRLGGGAELIDCAAHDTGPNGPLWHGPGAKLQPSWRPLIASLVAFKGTETYDPRPYGRTRIDPGAGWTARNGSPRALGCCRPGRVDGD